MRLQIRRIVNELDLETGTYVQALLISNGAHETLVHISDAAFEDLMTTFSADMGALTNPENAQVPVPQQQGPRQVKAAPRGSAGADRTSLLENATLDTSDPDEGWVLAPELEQGSDDDA